MRNSTQEQGRARRARAGSERDAIALLKADHRQVERWFAQIGKAKKTERKEMLAKKICESLRMHMRIEEEIFYPAFLVATQETDLHHEAEVEHAGARRLIGEIEAMRPGDEYYDAKVKVLSEMIKHHVKEEEKPGGLFSEARKSEMDLDDLGRRMAVRKREIEESRAGANGNPGLVRGPFDG